MFSKFNCFGMRYVFYVGVMNVVIPKDEVLHQCDAR